MMYQAIFKNDIHIILLVAIRKMRKKILASWWFAIQSGIVWGTLSKKKLILWSELTTPSPWGAKTLQLFRKIDFLHISKDTFIEDSKIGSVGKAPG